MIYDVKPLKEEILQEIEVLKQCNKDVSMELDVLLHMNTMTEDDDLYLKSIKRLMNKHGVSINEKDIDTQFCPVMRSKPFIIIGKDTEEWHKKHAPLHGRNTDMDGILAYQKELLYANPHSNQLIKPCTAEAVIRILYDIERRYFNGKKYETVTVFGRGSVGKPTALLMLADDRTVSICHSRTSLNNKDLYLSLSHITVLATGHRNLLTLDDLYGTYVGHDTIIIDAGISVDENGKTVGDANPEVYKELKDKDHVIITKVPGGVGAITPLILLEHVLRFYK